jgi:hypothetical protein
VIRHGERCGCGNAASGSARRREARSCCEHPHLLSCVHQSLRAYSSKSWKDRVRNPCIRKEWSTATYYNVRTGEPCRITTGDSTSDNIIPVGSYRSVLNAYVNNAESKFNGPDGKQCCSWTRGMLQRMHVVAGEHRYCGKELKRKLEQGPVDHEAEFKCRVYENGRVAAGPETLGQLARIFRTSN